MSCPKAQDWDLLATEALDERAAEPLRAHLKECAACRDVHEQARRAHLDRVRMYDQFDGDHGSLREQLMSALPDEPKRSRADGLVRSWRRMGDFMMSASHILGARAAIGVLSAAACIALVVTLSITFAGGRNAFAQAIQQFQNAKTIVCRVSTSATVSGITTHTTGKMSMSAEYGSHMDISMNGVTMMTTYTSLQGAQTYVHPQMKTYTVVNTQAIQEPGQAGNDPDGFIRALARLKADAAARELGRQKIDGIDALGYEISGQLLGLGQGEGIRSELWIDANTLLPVRYVADVPLDQTGSTMQMVFDQFEWDQPLEPALFTPDIPADYTRIDATAPTSDEASLIKALGNYAALTGKYPSTFDASNIVTEFSSALGARIAKAMAKGERAPDQKELMQKSVEIGSGMKYYLKLATSGASPEYFGKTVKPGQADAVLLRWKLPTGQSRIVYGNLRVETTSGQ
jgi:outer membrane lipoprotein-sorting protein